MAFKDPNSLRDAMALLALSEKAATGDTMSAVNLNVMMEMLSVEEARQIVLYLIMLCHSIYEILPEEQRPKPLHDFMYSLITLIPDTPESPEPE